MVKSPRDGGLFYVQSAFVCDIIISWGDRAPYLKTFGQLGVLFIFQIFLMRLSEGEAADGGLFFVCRFSSAKSS